MSHLLDEVLAQAANGSPATVALSSESVAVLLLGSKYLEDRASWLDRAEFPLDEVTDADWDAIEKLVGNAYYEIMSPIIGFCFPLLTALPSNCLLLDGSTYAREDYPILYSVLDAVFIINADTFFVPDLRSRVPIGAGEGAGLSSYEINQQGGEEEHALTDDENGTHAHAIGGAGTGLALAPGELPVLVPSIFPGSTDNSGLGMPHNNIQPYTALPWAVVAL